jgi:hypothetical protein
VMGHWTIPYNWENDMKGYRYTRPTPNTAEDRTGKKNAPLLGMRTWMDYGKRRSIIPLARRLEFICIYFDVQAAHELVLSGR